MAARKCTDAPAQSGSEAPEEDLFWSRRKEKVLEEQDSFEIEEEEESEEVEVESVGGKRSGVAISNEVKMMTADASTSVPVALADLRSSHDKLQQHVRQRVHRALEDETSTGATVKSFAGTSMATIAGWLTAETCYHAILRLLSLGYADSKLISLLARTIYAVIASMVVPFVDWSLMGRTDEDRRGVLHDQARLVRLCLPMMFAWAWKDVVSAALAVVGDHFWTELVVALVTTSLAVLVEITPCYRRAVEALRQGEGGTALSRVPAMFSNVGLAVGFAWNAVLKWAPKKVIVYVQAPIFIFMIVVIYYLVVTAAIVLVTVRLTREEKPVLRPCSPMKRSCGSMELDDIEADDSAQRGASSIQLVLSKATSVAGNIEKASHNITISTLHFVYAWAQLDTVNALFFIYLLGCDGPKTCGYTYNFVFSIIVSVVFARMSMHLKLSKRETKRDKASKALLMRALSLNTGWAWINYCLTAIDDSQVNGELDPLYLYIICTAFAWLCISCLHHRFEVDRRAWEVHCKEEAEVCELTLAA